MMINTWYLKLKGMCILLVSLHNCITMHGSKNIKFYITGIVQLMCLWINLSFIYKYKNYIYVKWHKVSVVKSSQLMLYTELMAVVKTVRTTWRRWVDKPPVFLVFQQIVPICITGPKMVSQVLQQWELISVLHGDELSASTSGHRCPVKRNSRTCEEDDKDAEPFWRGPRITNLFPFRELNDGLSSLRQQF